MSAPHADDADHARPGGRRNGHPSAGILDGPVVPSPRPGPGAAAAPVPGDAAADGIPPAAAGTPATDGTAPAGTGGAGVSTAGTGAAAPPGGAVPDGAGADGAPGTAVPPPEAVATGVTDPGTPRPGTPVIPGPRPATAPAGAATVAEPVPPGGAVAPAGGTLAPAGGTVVHPGLPGAPGRPAPAAAGPAGVPGTGTPTSTAGPHTPPLPWPAITTTAGTPVPAVYPPEQPAPPAWRKALDLVDAGRVAGLSAAVRGTVGHRTAAITVGATFALAVGVLVAAYTGAGQDSDAPESAAAPAPAAVPPDLVSGTTAANPVAFGATPSFTSPSGNIACRIDGAAARCDVENKRWTPTGADDCTDAGLVVGGTAGSRASCAGTPVRDDGEELGYGTHLTHGDLTCVSRRSGVECRDGRTGHGFTAARASYRLY